MIKPFTICKVSWQTQVKRNYEFDKELVYTYFKQIINYLQENGLTTKTILNKEENISEDTSILSTDLTEEGFELIKKKYDKWTEGIMDKGKSPSDFTIFDKELKKMRSK